MTNVKLRVNGTQVLKTSSIITVMGVIAVILNWHFYAMYSILLILFDLPFFLVFSITVLHNIIWAILNGKIYDRSWLPMLINLLIFVPVICLPSVYRNKSYPKEIIPLNHSGKENCLHGLYLDTYFVRGGYLSTDLNAIYLTDKKTFRCYLGVQDEGSKFMDIGCKGDSIIVKTYKEISYTEKRSTRGIMWITRSTMERTAYNLNDLKRQHHFD